MADGSAGSVDASPRDGNSTPPPFVPSPVSWSVSRHTWPTDDRNLVLADLDRIAALRAKLVRTDLWWYEIEPKRDQFSQAALDYYRWFVDAAASKGLGVIVILSNPPDWARLLYVSGQRQAFFEQVSQYAARVAETVADKVTYYQLSNESNVDLLLTSDDVTFFIVAREAISKHDASFSTIVNLLVDAHDSSACPNWQCDLKDYLNQGARSSIDILAIDYYPGTWSIGDWGDATLDRLFRLGKDYGKPVAIMETGFSSTGCLLVIDDEQAQKRWITEQLSKIRNKVADLSAQQKVPLLIANWFKLDDPNTASGNCLDLANVENHFGIVRTNRTQKPGYETLKSEIGKF